MQYWLLKSEPSSYSWDQQVADKRTHWDGVRNYQAQNNMKQMKKGDLAFFYHSVKEKRIVGVVEVVEEFYLEPGEPRFGMVDVAAKCVVPQPVTLAEIKARPELQDIALIRQSRLSVMPIDKPAWDLICRMGEINL